ncbi:MAG: hypothetical protein KAI50_06820 [Desulfobacterales bacterium]|nr:hypothetical protein [Desulfobacterales bacterium]
MASLEELARIAEIEFSDIVDAAELLGTKLRIMLTKKGFVDVWLSRKLPDRFGYHWEEESTGLFYRYDNFPDTKWKYVPTYPYHFHNGSQDNVTESSRFEKDIEGGFRNFMSWVRSKSSTIQ